MKLIDYIHFYPNIPLLITDGEYRFTHYLEGVDFYQNKIIAERVSWDCKDIKPILRKLNTITSEELNEYDLISDLNKNKFHLNGIPFQKESLRTRFLLNKGFDIFGLIDVGLAIEEKDLFETITK